MAIYYISKKLGETPLLALERVRKENKIGMEVPMTYAGRLDPAAEGLLIVLSGEDVHKKDEYKDMPKVYEVDLVFGLATDTADLLGILSSSADAKFFVPAPTFGRIKGTNAGPSGTKNLTSTTLYTKLIGTREQKFHPFSSKPINGKPLWAHTKEKNDIEIPSHTITVEKIDLLKEENISFNEVLERVKFILNEVTGDFRQNEILESWKNKKESLNDVIFKKITIEVHCSSGTYMRVLAEEISIELEVPVLASRIFRKSIGKIEILG